MQSRAYVSFEGSTEDMEQSSQAAAGNVSAQYEEFLLDNESILENLKFEPDEQIPRRLLPPEKRTQQDDYEYEYYSSEEDGEEEGAENCSDSGQEINQTSQFIDSLQKSLDEWDVASGSSSDGQDIATKLTDSCHPSPILKKTQAASSLRGSTTGSFCDDDCLAARKVRIIQKWREEDASNRQSSEKWEEDDFFKQKVTPFKFSGVKRKREVDSLTPDVNFAKKTIAIPPNPSERLKAELKMPIIERLMTPRKSPAAKKCRKGRKMDPKEFNEFLYRQNRSDENKKESMRPRRELSEHRPISEKTIQRLSKPRTPEKPVECETKKTGVWSNDPRLWQKSEKREIEEAAAVRTSFISKKSKDLTNDAAPFESRNVPTFESYLKKVESESAERSDRKSFYSELE